MNTPPRHREARPRRFALHRPASITSLLGVLAVGACTGVLGDDGAEHGGPDGRGAGSGEGGGSSGSPLPPGTDYKGCPPEGNGNLVSHERLFACDAQRDLGASEQRIWRLNDLQYQSSIKRFTRGSFKMLSNPLSGEAAPDHGFSTSAVSLGLDATTVSELLVTADEVMDDMFAEGSTPRHEELLACAADVTDACLRELFTGWIKLAFRRPATEDDLARYVDLVQGGVAELGGEEAMKLGIEALLSSPEHLFRFEIGAPDQDEHGRRRLTAYEIASALAFGINSEPPRDDLLQAAERGELDTDEGVRAQAKVMILARLDQLDIREPMTHGGYHERDRTQTIRGFVEEWLRYLQAMSVVKDPEQYPLDPDGDVPQWNGEKRARETGRFVTGLLKQRADFIGGLLTSDAYYGKDENEGDFYGGGGELRRGILSHPSLLGVISRPTETDPIRRGRFVAERLLCGVVPDANIDDLPQLSTDTSLTMRERLAQHTAQESCRACHALMDPLGLASEAFDTAGWYRSTEAGRPIDSRGAVPGALIGQADDIQVSGPVELAEQLAGLDCTRQCFVRHAFRYWVGRNEAPADACSLVDADRAYQESGGDLAETLAALFVSPSFLYRRTADDECGVPGSM